MCYHHGQGDPSTKDSDSPDGTRVGTDVHFVILTRVNLDNVLDNKRLKIRGRGRRMNLKVSVTSQNLE
jgi:hypothetical protein